MGRRQEQTRRLATDMSEREFKASVGLILRKSIENRIPPSESG
jgi:hypothetical protein